MGSYLEDWRPLVLSSKEIQAFSLLQTLLPSWLGGDPGWNYKPRGLWQLEQEESVCRPMPLRAPRTLRERRGCFPRLAGSCLSSQTDSPFHSHAHASILCLLSGSETGKHLYQFRWGVIYKDSLWSPLSLLLLFTSGAWGFRVFCFWTGLCFLRLGHLDLLCPGLINKRLWDRSFIFWVAISCPAPALLSRGLVERRRMSCTVTMGERAWAGRVQRAETALFLRAFLLYLMISFRVPFYSSFFFSSFNKWDKV